MNAALPPLRMGNTKCIYRRPCHNPFNGRFKPGTFFVSSIILRAKHELTSKAASKSVLLQLLQVGPASKIWGQGLIVRPCFSVQLHFESWMMRQFFLADQNQHVSKPTWVKSQCTVHYVTRYICLILVNRNKKIWLDHATVKNAMGSASFSNA